MEYDDTDRQEDAVETHVRGIARLRHVRGIGIARLRGCSRNTHTGSGQGGIGGNLVADSDPFYKIRGED